MVPAKGDCRVLQQGRHYRSGLLPDRQRSVHRFSPLLDLIDNDWLGSGERFKEPVLQKIVQKVSLVARLRTRLERILTSNRQTNRSAAQVLIRCKYLLRLFACEPDVEPL